MKMMTEVVALALLMTCCSVAARADWLEDIVGIYFQRIDKIESSAGNAAAVNTVTHVIDPWPRLVHNRRIPANGQRMVGGIVRYRLSRPGPPPISPEIGAAGGASTTTAPAAIPLTGQ
jgi:hypothetical protein